MIIDIQSYGASPNSPDNVASIQKALDQALPGDMVYVPPGQFLVSAATGGLRPRSGTRMKIDGSLRVIPNDQVESKAILLSAVNDVVISGPGAIIGERAGHLAPGPARNGGNVYIVSSTNITLDGNLMLRDSWSDGAMVVTSKNVVMSQMFFDNNSRNGLSIISVEGMKVASCIFSNTNSGDPMPQAGIDIEPNLAEEKLLDVIITNNQFIKNKGAGVYVAFTPSAIKTRVSITNNSFEQHYKDGNGPPVRGVNPFLANFCYSVFRWVPGYDWWFFPKEFSAS